MTSDRVNRDDRIPAELFQILKDAVKVLHSVCQQMLKTQQRPQDWKRSVLIPFPKKVIAKEYSSYHIIAVFSHPINVTLKILQARLQQYKIWELTYVRTGIRKGRGTRSQVANIHWIMERAREFQKNISSASLTILKSLTVWITTNCGKILNRWEYQITLHLSP